MKFNALIPEFAVTNLAKSLLFYRNIIGFEVAYQRPEEGFAFLQLGAAQLMIDQIDLGRTFDREESPVERPFGRGLNVQIQVPAVMPLVAALAASGRKLHLPLEEKWYRAGDVESGNCQFVVADPDGYLLRFFEDLGERPLST